MSTGSYLALDNIRVGIVDDNAYFRRIVRTMLSGLGIRQVFDGTTVDEGWQIVSLSRPEVLLLDWNLGKGSGVDLLDRIRTSRNDAIATQAVMFLSAHSDRRHVLMAAKLGANDFIVKPVSPRLIYDRLRRLVTTAATYERRHGRTYPVAPTRLAPLALPPQTTQSETLFI